MIGHVIVPGIGGSDATHWQTRWQQQWGADAVRIEPVSWSHPELGDWVTAIERAVRAIEPRVDGIALVAHSLGCWAVSEWLRHAPVERPIGAFFVAPPDPAGEAFPARDAPTFVSLREHRLPCASVVVASADDPYCDRRRVDELADGWGSGLLVAGSIGHINSASGIGDWATGKDALDRLESRLAESAST
ncbi:RBBP9/YdeN family alpha/beta hydrolase [Leifsonia sp. Le1]|uniref:RBBP9/YdeN family alpha/beta hydrolase n=1 Tax=Leifsonia sp. Le1 TaxID=3404918 RepID=UPI003EBDFFBA